MGAAISLAVFPILATMLFVAGNLWDSRLGIAIHIGGDLFTAYGTMMLAPFSHYRFAFPFSFIIDLYFTSIIVIGVAGVMLIRQRRYPAVIALMVLAGYVGFHGILHSHNIARSHILS